MNRTEIESMQDLVDTTIKDLCDITVLKDLKKEVINVDCYFFGKEKIIELSCAEIMLNADSAKEFINYLKEKITEGLKEMYHE